MNKEPLVLIFVTNCDGGMEINPSFHQTLKKDNYLKMYPSTELYNIGLIGALRNKKNLLASTYHTHRNNKMNILDPLVH